MTRFTSKQQLEFIEVEIMAWIREDVDPALKFAINRRKAHIPEETLSNIQHEVFTALGDAMAMYQLKFQDSGRHVDMRRLIFDKRPVRQGNNFIFDWARKRGLGKFRKGVPGYSKQSSSKLSDEQKLMRIASAIIVAKSEGAKHKRRGQWYSKLIYQLISRLTARLTRIQADWIRGATREEIEKAFTLGVGDLRVFRYKIKK